VAWQKLWRLAGVDHMHVNGIANKFQEDDDTLTMVSEQQLEMFRELELAKYLGDEFHIKANRWRENGVKLRRIEKIMY
jgi:ribulose 1,5-bisphosphate carboxylase large subunit-like protein